MEKKYDIMSKLTAVTSATRMVFSNKLYLLLGILVATIFWFLLNVFGQTLFLSPVLTFYLSSDSVAGFLISNVTAVLLGIVVPMNIYAFRQSNLKLGAAFFSGPVTGVVPSICASCSSVGLFLATSFGAAGVATSAFLTNYDIPLRLGAIGLLLYAYYSANRKLNSVCARQSEK